MVLFYCHIARDELVRTLKKCGFIYQEFLLSPTCVSNVIVKIFQFKIFLLIHLLCRGADLYILFLSPKLFLPEFVPGLCHQNGILIFSRRDVDTETFLGVEEQQRQILNSSSLTILVRVEI